MKKFSGILSMTKSTYGFIIFEDQKYYVAGINTLNAHNNDLVEFELITYNGKQEAKITKVVKRETEEFTGVITVYDSFAFVSIKSFYEDVYIKKTKRFRAKTGDLVKIKIYDWGNNNKKAEAKIVKIYGSSEIADTINEVKIEESGVETVFSDECIAEVNKIKNPDIEKELKNRIDLRETNHITIDGVDTKDIDDSIYLEKLEKGYKLYVSIADVSYFVKKDSFLDLSARNRGNSIYLYNKVIPMLPKRLSNDLCSLNVGEDKLTFTVEIVYNDNGKVISSDCYKSVINSKYKFNYDEVNEILEGKSKNNILYTDMLFYMNELSKKLESERNRRGAIDFDIPEIKLNMIGNSVESIELRNRYDAEKLIESFMIAANEEIANRLMWEEIPTVYRIHEAPDMFTINELNMELTKLGYPIIKPEHITSSKFQKLIDKTRNLNISYLVHKMVLKAMQKAVYSPINKGHFGLASMYYLHFTSPIRRYSDLVVHRILDISLNRYMDKKEKVRLFKELKQICLHITNTEKIAQNLEIDTKNTKICEYMTRYLGDTFKAIVSGMNSSKVFVRLSNYAEATLITKNKEYIIGTEIEVLVISIDIYNSEIIVKEI